MINKEVPMESIPKCDLCKESDALYDGKTLWGPWAYMCEDCQKEIGTNLKQKLVLKERR